MYIMNQHLCVSLKMKQQWENRDYKPFKTSKEDAMKNAKEEWKQMGEDMVEEMKYDNMQGYENGLGLDLSDGYVVVPSPNGYYVKSDKNFPNNITGYSRSSFGG